MSNLTFMISTATISLLRWSLNIIISIAPPQLWGCFIQVAYSAGDLPKTASLKNYGSFNILVATKFLKY